MLFSTSTGEPTQQPLEQPRRFSKAGLSVVLLISAAGMIWFTPMFIAYAKQKNSLFMGLSLFSLICYAVSFAGSVYWLMKRRTK